MFSSPKKKNNDVMIVTEILVKTISPFRVLSLYFFYRTLTEKNSRPWYISERNVGLFGRHMGFVDISFLLIGPIMAAM